MPSRSGLPITFHVAPIDKEELKRRAEARGLSLAAYVRWCIDSTWDSTSRQLVPTQPKGAHWAAKRAETRARNTRAAMDRQTKIGKYIDNHQPPKRKPHWLDDEDPGTYTGEMYDNILTPPKGRGPV